MDRGGIVSFESPDYAEQPLLMVCEIFLSRPSPHGQIDRERFFRLVEANLDLKILVSGAVLGASNPDSSREMSTTVPP